MASVALVSILCPDQIGLVSEIAPKDELLDLKKRYAGDRRTRDLSYDQGALQLRPRDGDPDAVRAVYREYGRLVYAVAYKVLGDQGLAEDATQQTFVQAWRGARRFEPTRELAPWLAGHQDVNAIDLTGVTEPTLAKELEVSAAENLKRIIRPATPDWFADPGLSRMLSLVETKTVWHPKGV